MEQFRRKIAYILSISVFLIFTIFNWYGKIDIKRIYTTDNRNYLNKEQKLERFGFVNIDTYDAFYENKITYVETRTMIPFVWEKKILNSTPIKLYTQKI